MESISAFELIKVGVGPSSSHTMGPWRSTLLFLERLDQSFGLENLVRLKITLYGSLAKTGKGHGTDVAILMGLRGEHYTTIDTTKIFDYQDEILENKIVEIRLLNGKQLDLIFDYDNDLIFKYDEFLPFHPNGVTYEARLGDGSKVDKTYYSVGGGFVIQEKGETIAKNPIVTPYPCHDAASIISNCKKLNCGLSELVRINELAWRTEEEIEKQALNLWNEMKSSIYRGVCASGILPGGLEVRRRASIINEKLLPNKKYKDIEGWISLLKNESFNFNQINKWISCFALAVNEENASYGRIVTAPTNGAAGVIPAVLMYAFCFEEMEVRDKEIIDFITVAGEIGSLFKKGATISAAMGGCQAEIGVSSAMAAAALTEIKGGTVGQVLMAAEIAMEHHLGMTCDPIKGLVQIPCIERNSMGAMKAITASNIAMETDERDAKVSLDQVIRSMKETAEDMNSKYKETSDGGLAIAVSLPEC